MIRGFRNYKKGGRVEKTYQTLFKEQYLEYVLAQHNKYSYYLRNIPIKEKMKGYDSNVRVLIFSVTEKETGDIYFFYPEYSKNILDYYKKKLKKN